MPHNIKEVQEMSIGDLVDKSVFKDLDKSSVWLRVYNTCRIRNHDLSLVGQYVKNSVSFKNLNLSIYCVKIVNNELKLPFVIQYEHSNINGTLTYHSELIYKELPKGIYVFLATPYKIDNLEGNEFITKTCLNETESILSLYLGNHFLYSIVFDGEMALTDKGRSTISGPPIPITHECNGPFLTEDNGDAVLKTFEEINT